MVSRNEVPIPATGNVVEYGEFEWFGVTMVYANFFSVLVGETLIAKNFVVVSVQAQQRRVQSTLAVEVVRERWGEG